MRLKKRLKEGINISELLKDAQKCKHDVYLETDDGDSLNLKSTFRRAFMTKFFQPEDLPILMGGMEK